MMERAGKKALKRGQWKKGFTLIELIVTIAVFSIFSLGVVGVVVPVLNIYGTAIKLSDARLVAENIAGTVENEFAFAQPSLAYGQAEGEEGAAEITSQGAAADAGEVLVFKSVYGTTRIASAPGDGRTGYLYMSRNDGDAEYKLYFDEKYYKGGTVDIAFARDGGDYNLIVMTIAVKDGDDTVFTLERAMKPPALRKQ